MTSPDNERLPNCPACARPMAHAHTIRRGLAPNLHIFRCAPCAITIQEPEGKAAER